jgi:predicted dehydrogenase
MNESKIGVCVIGAGRAGMIHAANFARHVPAARLAAIVDANEAVARKSAEEVDCPCYYVDVESALRQSDVDAVVIVTPTRLHLPIAVAAAAAGKHILCEKPMAMTENECEQIIIAAETNHVKLQIGFMRRFDAGYLEAKRIADSKAIGDIVMVRSNTRGPSVPQPWMYDIRISNGQLAEVNSHDIDTLRWFTESEFKTVYTAGGNYRCPEAVAQYPDFYDNVIVAATFANGMQGMIDGAHGVGYAYDSRVEVLGTKGCIFIGRLQDQAVLTCTAENRMAATSMVGSWRNLFQEAYLNEDRDFIDCILNDRSPKVTGHDGRMAVRVVNAGNQSIREKRMIDLSVEL